MNESITVIDDQTAEIMQPQQTGGALLDTGADDIIYLAERADKMVDALNKIMNAALRITSEYDWCCIGGKPYLQESGATKVARLFGISIQIIGSPTIEVDRNGYKTFTYKARFTMNGQYIDCEGSRSMKDDFFARTKNGLKSPDEIDERDVKMAAYTNCVNNGIKRLVPGLRGLDMKALEDAGLDTSRISGYTFKTGSKGGSSGKAEDSGLVCADCHAAITQTVASYSQGKFGRQLCMNCQKKASAAAPDAAEG